MDSCAGITLAGISIKIICALRNANTIGVAGGFLLFEIRFIYSNQDLKLLYFTIGLNFDIN
jgi:hypothetical protein